MTSVVCSSRLSYTSAYMDYSFSRDSNSAGAPLPRIPRRAQPQRTQSASAVAGTSLQNLFLTPPAKFVVHPPTPPSKSPSPLSKHLAREANGNASSSSGSESYVEMLGSKSRRSRKQQSDLRPPEHSTPTPAVFEAQLAWPTKASPISSQSEGDDTPRASSTKKPDATRLQTKTGTSSSTPASAANSTGSSSASSRVASVPLGRKKSGEPLKSSLKSRRPAVRGDLSVITGPVASKSEPTTPTHIKSVHFDSKLEHVKLFLAEQKPLAVSRDGSPNDDTSGTDSDFPSFIFGQQQSEEDRIRTALTIDVVNLPPRVPADADVALESLILAQDGSCINGVVQVRNIAYEKWVAGRFTFDWWQTTSEVTAKYFESLPGGKVDRFSFSIRLNDMLKRIEEKTFFLAIRYSVAGREIWDNNGGNNYQVKFKVQPPKPAPSQLKASVSVPNSTLPNTASPTRVADLKSKLEQVAKGREDSEQTVGGMLVQSARRSPTKLPNDGEENFTLKPGVSLSARYDFSASLRAPWKAPSPTSPDERPRTNTYPNGTLSFPQRRALHEKKPFGSDPRTTSRGSPRIVGEDDANTPQQFHAESDVDDTPVPPPARRRTRNHQRGYVESGMSPSPSVRRTPPGSPRAESSSLRFHSFPADRQSYRPLSLMEVAVSTDPVWFTQAGSEDSTPSVTSTSDTSESSRDCSPLMSPISQSMQLPESPTDTTYNVFLNKFCFYTGSDSLLDVPADTLQRSLSASSLEGLLSTPPQNGLQISPSRTPTRSSSFDDVVTISGSSTPTMNNGPFGSPSSSHSTPTASVH